MRDRDRYRRRVLGRLALAFSLVACGGAPSSSEEAPPPSETTTATFTPPSPLGCSNAGGYDYCFAFDHATPLAVRVALPDATPEGAVGTVRFRREAGAPEAVLNSVSFALPAAKKDLVFYFQVYPATYTIEVDVSGDRATTEPLAIGELPVLTSLTLVR